MTKGQHRSKTFTGGLVVSAAGVLLAIIGVSASAGAAGRTLNDHQVTVCHATSSATNPYSVTYPAKWQITAPTGHAWDEGDIIPPYAAGSNGNKAWAAFTGLNWDEAGQAIWDAGCTATEDDGTVLPPAPAGTVTLDKVVTGEGRPAEGTGFTFSVTCDAGDVPAAEVTLAAGDDPLLVASGLSEGDTCTIDETDAAGAAATSFAVDGGAAQAGPVEVTLESDDHAAAVVATNTYECATGQLADESGACTTDACPDVTGLQTDAAGCDPELIPSLVVEKLPSQAQGTPPARLPVQVAGIQVRPATAVAASSPQLPVTGGNTTTLIELGLGLVLLGAGALVFARDEAATA